jgi:hypothetical protein
MGDLATYQTGSRSVMNATCVNPPLQKHGLSASLWLILPKEKRRDFHRAVRFRFSNFYFRTNYILYRPKSSSLRPSR